MRKVYNKLVRDQIIKIILADGAKPSFHRAHSDKEFQKFLAIKLLEEIEEFEAARSEPKKALIELSDVLAVVVEWSKILGALYQAEIIADRRQEPSVSGSLRGIGREFTSHPTVELLLELLGVIAIEAAELPVTWNNLELMRVERQQQRGGFESRIILEYVDENPAEDDGPQ